ncbi:proline dehydrogenase, partial [bacterium (candidate division B38) B3_B38]
LFRTEKDIEELDGFQAHIRLCIGIYRELPEIGLQNKKDMKEKLLIYMERLFEKGHFVAIATHDERLIHRCMELLQNNKVPPEQYEFQMLAGVPREKIQNELIRRGHTMRVYIPFAEDWKDAIAYCKRRLIANRSMGFYVARNWCKKLLGKR